LAVLGFSSAAVIFWSIVGRLAIVISLICLEKRY
jgi:hypothetical protein